MQLPRHILADLDALNRDARASMQLHPNKQEGDDLDAKFPLDPVKLSMLLQSGGEARRMVGIHTKLPETNAQHYLAAGWSLLKAFCYRPSSLLNTDERLPMVLVTAGGEEFLETLAWKNLIEECLTKGWHVEFFCFLKEGGGVAADLLAKYPTRFQTVYLGKRVAEFLSESSIAESERLDRQELVRLQQQIQQLQTDVKEQQQFVDGITSEYKQLVKQNGALKHQLDELKKTCSRPDAIAPLQVKEAPGIRVTWRGVLEALIITGLLLALVWQLRDKEALRAALLVREKTVSTTVDARWAIRVVVISFTGLCILRSLLTETFP